jgi:hypothetical protein
MAKFHFNIVQCSKEWHEIRRGKVGGSSASGLFTDSETLLNQLIDECTEDYNENEEGFVSAAMEHGILHEPEARGILKEYLSLDFLECGWIENNEYSLIGISPDGITADFKDACEIKCPNNKKHIINIRFGVQKDNIHQIIHNFTANKYLERLHWMSYRPTNKYKPFVVYTFTLESLVDLGTKAKPQIKTIRDWVQIAHQEAVILEEKLKVELNNLKSI